MICYSSIIILFLKLIVDNSLIMIYDILPKYNNFLIESILCVVNDVGLQKLKIYP